MNNLKRKLIVNSEQFQLPQLYDYRTLSEHKETFNNENRKRYISLIPQSPPQKPQHMKNILRRNQMLKLQLKRVSPPRLQYETLEEIYFIRYRKII